MIKVNIATNLFNYKKVEFPKNRTWSWVDFVSRKMSRYIHGMRENLRNNIEYHDY